MRVIIQSTPEEVARWAAAYIVGRIKQHQAKTDKPFVLGLPTGSTPLGTYKELIGYYQRGEVSFGNVITFNMDEYVGLPKEHPESYYYFMWHNFFSHIDIKRENTNILDGNAPDLDRECEAYEEKITAAGGIDFFLGGIGPDGHLAFNEPFSSMSSRTRSKNLCKDTIIANSRFFGGDRNMVPKTALTVGIATIMDAREVMVLATGHSKARAVAKGIEGSYNHQWTISALQLHRSGFIVCDEDAAGELKVNTYKYFKDIEMENIDPRSKK